MLQEEPLCGVAQAKVLCPQKIIHPFLLYLTKRGTVVNPICRLCAEQQRQDACKHKPQTRAWIGTYTMSDLNYARSLGYSVELFECYHYKQQKPIFKDFMTVMFYERIKVSNFPVGCETEQQQEAYCAEVNQKMNFVGPWQVVPSDISDNPCKKKLYKNLMNEFIGKFAQKRAKTKSVIVSSHYEIEKIFQDSAREIDYIEGINEHFCQLSVTSKTPTKSPNRKTNCILAACITSNSRIFMHKKMNAIASAGGTIFYTSTDNMCYSLPTNTQPPLHYGHCIDDFKKEFGDHLIVEFYSLGPKEISITYKTTATGKIVTCLKVRGLCLSNLLNQDLISPALLNDFLDKFFNDEVASLSIPQLRKMPKSKIRKKREIRFTNSMTTKRAVLRRGDDLTVPTRPFGYIRC